MVDMSPPKTLAEWEKIFPAIKEGHGVLNIDIGVYFPYNNQELVTCEFGLINDSILDDEDGEDENNYLYPDVVHNHRYPNHGFITLSRKTGRKICKTGYPLYAPVDELNGYKMLIVKLGIRKHTVFMCFPLNITLTRDKPIGGLELLIHNWELPEEQEESKNMGFDFTTYETGHDEEHDINYGIGKRFIVGKPFNGPRNGDVTLHPISIARLDLAGFEPAIEIKGQPTRTFYL